MDANGMQCCGWKEISGLAAYTNYTFHSALSHLFRASGMLNSAHSGVVVLTCGSIIFTANVPENSKNYAVDFANDLKKANIGTITALPIFINPNTQRRITSFVWTIDKPALQAYLKQHDLVSMALKPYGPW